MREFMIAILNSEQLSWSIVSLEMMIMLFFLKAQSEMLNYFSILRLLELLFITLKDRRLVVGDSLGFMLNFNYNFAVQ